MTRGSGDGSRPSRAALRPACSELALPHTPAGRLKGCCSSGRGRVPVDGVGHDAVGTFVSILAL